MARDELDNRRSGTNCPGVFCPAVPHYDRKRDKTICPRHGIIADGHI